MAGPGETAWSDRRLNFVGGGPSNGVHPAYERELMRIADRFLSDDASLEAWWAPSPVPRLEVWYWMDRDRVCYRTRRSAARMTAQIERSARSTREASDPAALARDDVRKLLERVAERLELGAVPPL